MDSQAPVIRVAGLRKVFHIYDRPFDLLREVLGGRSKARLFTALEDISFEVARGEAVGVLGRNGAGKSTLLRIISKTLDATEGEVAVQGRLSSILELGTGFNGALTGRENVIVGGLMIGLSREEILDKLEWILDFSELRDFIDQPFRTYSSGMQARLTFATAVCVRPELLVVDEALSVGDARFQRKCFSHMHSLRAEGCTILLVSHDPNTVAAFCDRALLLERGRLVIDGSPQKVGALYHQMMFGDGGTSLALGADETPGSRNGRPAALPGADEAQASGRSTGGGEKSAGGAGASVATGSRGWSRRLRTGTLQEAEVTGLEILDERGAPTTRLETGRRYRLRVTALFRELVLRPTAGFSIRNALGQTLFGIDTRSAGFELPPRAPGDTLVVELDLTLWLTNGPFFLGGGVGSTHDGVDAYAIDYCHDAIQFDIPRLDGLQHSSVVNLEARFRRSEPDLRGAGEAGP